MYFYLSSLYLPKSTQSPQPKATPPYTVTLVNDRRNYCRYISSLRVQYTNVIMITLHFFTIDENSTRMLASIEL